MWIALMICGVIVIFILGFGVYTAAVTTHPKKTSMEDAWNNEMSKDFVKKCDMNPSSVYTITTDEGYVLHASFLPAYDYMDEYGRIDEYDYKNPKTHLSEGPKAREEYRAEGGPDNCNGQRFIIISHGYTYNRHGSMKYATIFRRHGYNCVIYDDRRHGENVKTLTTFGREESKDLMAVIKDTRRRFGGNIALGCHGESMGTGLSITALQYEPDIDFIVADCGYADLENVVKEGMAVKFHLPSFLGSLGGVISRILFGYNYMKIAPIEHMGSGKVPICFAHGGADDFILPVNSQRMNEAYSGYSEYHEFPGAAHGLSIDSDPEGYEKMVLEFLKKVYGA